MQTADLFRRYVLWHYSEAFADIARVFINLAWFFWRVFSVRELTRNLFTPFQRLDERPTRRFSAEDQVGAIIVNSLMRGVGVAVRLPLIVAGAFGAAASLFLMLLAYPLWALLPIVVPLCVVGGFVTFGGAFL